MKITFLNSFFGGDDVESCRSRNIEGGGAGSSRSTNTSEKSNSRDSVRTGDSSRNQTIGAKSSKELYASLELMEKAMDQAMANIDTVMSAVSSLTNGASSSNTSPEAMYEAIGKQIELADQSLNEVSSAFRSIIGKVMNSSDMKLISRYSQVEKKIDMAKNNLERAKDAFEGIKDGSASSSNSTAGSGRRSNGFFNTLQSHRRHRG